MRLFAKLILLLGFSVAGIAAALLLADATPRQPRSEAHAKEQFEPLHETLPPASPTAIAATSPETRRGTVSPPVYVLPQPQYAQPYPLVAQQQTDPSIESLGPLLDLLKNVPELKNLAGGGDAGSGSRTEPPGAPNATNRAEPPSPPTDTQTAAPTKPLQQAPVVRSAEGDDQLSFNISGMEIRTALEWLSEQGGLNIIAMQSVSGVVNSVALNNVDAETALNVILESTGFVMHRKGRFIYVGTPEDFDNLKQLRDTISTRIYRPNYVAGAELQALITPLLSAAGSISVTSATEVGIQTDADNAGGDSLASGDAVLVRDYELVLHEIDQVIAELDKRPMQVAIEAMILSVKLNDANKFGINWQFLRDRNNVRFGLGSPRINPLNGTGTTNAQTGGTIGEFTFDGGLAFAFLDSNLGAFIDALETIGDTNVIATPRLMCLNKQRAEILIGAELGYVSTTVTQTQSTQSVQFLRVGTELRLRPFISSDGMIRMEVHPQLSTGAVRVEGGFTIPDKEVTEVTTNIMTRDGCTVIIGGLVREDLSVTSSQIPYLGSLPYVGALFRQRNEEIERSEIVVLITPNIIYEPETCGEGEAAACEMHRRQAVYGDHMSPISKRYLGRKYRRLSQEALAVGDANQARRFADFSVRLDPSDRAAIDLQSDIDSGQFDGDHSSTAPVIKGGVLYDPTLYPDHGHVIAPDIDPSSKTWVEGDPVNIRGSLDGEEIAPWILNRLEQPQDTQPLHPRDPGRPGEVRQIEPGGDT